jgi:hypothetical protein
MASIKSLSVVPHCDSDAFRSEVELFNSHGEFPADSHTVFIYEGRGRIEDTGFDGTKDINFLNNGIESGKHLHVSLDGSGDILVRGNLDLGNLINLELEITSGFSVPLSSLRIIEENPECLSIIRNIVSDSYENGGEGPVEYIDDEQVTFASQTGDYIGIFSGKNAIDVDESAQSYSMVLYLPVVSKDLIRGRLVQLAEAFDDLEMEYFVAGSTTDGDYEEGSPLVGPAARIDASFGDIELYIVDDEICIEGS